MRILKVTSLVSLVAAVPAGAALGFAIIDSPPPPSGVVGKPYSYVFQLAEATPPYEVHTKAGDVPPGLAIEPDGTFHGTPTEAGTFAFTVEATQYCGCPTERPFTVTVRDALSITTSALPGAVVGTPYDQPVTVTGDGGLGMSWSISAGALPPGLTIAREGSPGNTVITGTPTTVGSFTFTVMVADSDVFLPDRSATRQLTIAVGAPLSVASSGAIATGVVGKQFRATPAVATGGVAPYAWSLAGGRLPPGLTLDPATGAISGVPTVAGRFSLSLRATDSGGRASDLDVVIPVIASLDLVTARLRAGNVGKLYKAALQVHGARGRLTFRITNGKLPASLELNARTGVISGLLRAAGTFRFTVTVRDGSGQKTSETLSLTVRR